MLGKKVEAHKAMKREQNIKRYVNSQTTGLRDSGK
jgi:hypothetical protein